MEQDAREETSLEMMQEKTMQYTWIDHERRYMQ